VREYLVELERENPIEPPVAQQEKVSTTDPDSTYATKGGPARLGYYDNYLVDNASCVTRASAGYFRQRFLWRLPLVTTSQFRLAQ